MSRPITPDEVVAAKRVAIPDAVFDAFNALIAKHWGGGSSSFQQKEIVSVLEDRGISSNEIFNNYYLDVEDIYREAGWLVEFDQPGFNETYEATFTFRKGKPK